MNNYIYKVKEKEKTFPKNFFFQVTIFIASFILILETKINKKILTYFLRLTTIFNILKIRIKTPPKNLKKVLIICISD